MTPRSNVAVCALALLISLTFVSTGAFAREGWFVGGGLGSMSASGDMDGNRGFVGNAGSEAVVPGKLASGTGWLIEGGYGINKYVALDLLFAETHHSASTSGAFALPNSTADISTALLGFRFTYPAVENSLDLFARLGLSSHTVKYADYGLQGSMSGGTFLASNSGAATFTGSGYGYGIGAEYFMGHVGLGLGITEFVANIDQATGITISGSLPSTLHETFTLADLTLLYHF